MAAIQPTFGVGNANGFTALQAYAGGMGGLLAAGTAVNVHENSPEVSGVKDSSAGGRSTLYRVGNVLPKLVYWRWTIKTAGDANFYSVMAAVLEFKKDGREYALDLGRGATAEQAILKEANELEPRRTLIDGVRGIALLRFEILRP